MFVFIFFFPNSALQNWGCGLSTDAAYTQMLMVLIIVILLLSFLLLLSLLLLLLLLFAISFKTFYSP